MYGHGSPEAGTPILRFLLNSLVHSWFITLLVDLLDWQLQFQLLGTTQNLDRAPLSRRFVFQPEG